MPRKKLDAGFVSPGISPPKEPDVVVVELRHDSRIGYSARGFGAPAALEKSADALNKVLRAFKPKKVRSHFGMTASEIRRRVTAAPPSLDQPVSAEFAHAGFVQVMPRAKKDAARLASRLKRLSSVWDAVVESQPVPAGAPTGSSPGSRNFEPSQGYLHSPPNGIGAMEVWRTHRAIGRGVTICDIEGNWNFTHEDLPRFNLIGGTLRPDISWKNHGTAVLGEMVSKPGRRGTVGIAHQARAVVQSAFIGGVFNTAAALANATRRLGEGDVILIELQARGPRGRYVAMQYWNSVFSAIRAALDKGITVVEAAGNGNENFNLPVFAGTGLQKDSGAILVGAGVPPTNFFDNFGPDAGFPRYSSIGVPRSRIWFSNYGKIVNVQAWGWHVTTTGYGDAQGGASQDVWCTLRFSGTSSASPIVTGAVACIQSRAKAKYGRPLSPRKVRDILIKSGTPQESGPGVPRTQRIGPQPNLPKALRLV